MTETDICNQALAALGHDRTISSLTDGSTEAARCAAFLAPARKAVLGSHDWGWLRQETPQVDGELAPDKSAYLFAYPAGALRLLGLFDADGRALRFRIANGTLLADVGVAAVAWVPDCEDPELWPAKVCDAVAYELAARLAGPMTQSAELAREMRQAAAFYLSTARAADANETAEPGTVGNRYADARA